ncbi:hypothetical protein SVIOM74S_03742 [Streptomyces violarus]
MIETSRVGLFSCLPRAALMSSGKSPIEPMSILPAVISSRPRIMPSWFHPMPNWSRSTLNSVSSVSPVASPSFRRAVRDSGLLTPRTVS